MMSKVITAALFVIVLGVFKEISAQKNCTAMPNRTISVYRGWPYLLDCDDFMTFVQAKLDDYYQSLTTTVRCQFIDLQTGKYVLNVSDVYADFDYIMSAHYTMDINVNSSYQVIVDVLDDVCQTTVVQFNVSDLPRQTCQEALASDVTFSNRRTLNQQSALSCNSPSNANVKVHLQTQHNFTSYWLYNCSRNLPNNTITLPSSSSPFHQLTLPSTGLNHAGVYTCVVEYNGMTRYVIYQDVCVRLGEALNKPLVSCKKPQYKVTLGENVTLECEAEFGPGSIKSVDSVWTRSEDSFECFSFRPPSLKPANGDFNHFCSQGRANSSNCFNTPRDYDPKDLAIQAKIPLYLHLVNVKESDIGVYMIRVKTLRSGYVNRTVAVELRQEEVLENRAVVVGTAVGCAVFLIVLLLVLIFFRFYVALFFKSCCGAYAADDKQFGVFLSYHFSTEIDTFAKKQVQEAWTSVREQLQALGFSIYDENRDGSESFRSSGTVSLMEQCHKVIVILTADFVNDNWSRFQLQQGFKKMIESGSKLIFILTPGMKEYIKQQSSKDDAYRMIHRAVKLNHSITWPCDVTCDAKRFRRELEYAMPKLRRGKSPENTMTPLNGAHPNGVDRLFSDVTVFTDISNEPTSPANV